MKKTNETLLKEIVATILLFASIYLLMNAIMSTRHVNHEQPSIQDLHQQQEMIDYHRAQGREILVK